MSRRLAKWKLSLFLIILFFTQDTGGVEDGDGGGGVQAMGSVLFEDHGFSKKCFIQNDVAMLATRLKFQDLLPDGGVQRNLMNDEAAVEVVRYFYGINEVIEKMNREDVLNLVMKSFYDLLGSYLKHQVLPVAKFSFYSGNITYSSVKNLFNLYERCKELLDTNGNGWRNPITDFSHISINIDPLEISKDDEMRACANLAVNQNDEDNEEDMLVPLPKMEIEEGEELSTIWLPLKRKHIYNINSKTSTFILLRFYVLVTQCHNFQGVDQTIFNRKLKSWVVENVLPYLEDDKLYPAFGAVLRILETIKDPNEDAYQGTKNKKSSKQNSFLSSRGVIFQDDEDFVNFSGSYDVKRWFWTVLFICCSVIFLLLTIFLIVRICLNRKKAKNNDSSKKQSFCSKISSCCRRSAHAAELDEFYQYKKVPSKERSVVFENEKVGRSKRKTKVKQEKFSLPYLDGVSNSEDEIVLHDSQSSKFKWGRKGKEGEKFKISESSDDERKVKKTSLIQQKSSLLSKLRQKSPTKGDRSRTDTSER